MSFSFTKLAVLLLALLTVAGSVLAAEQTVGVGIQVVPVATGELTVIAVVDGSSAAKAGVRPGDLLTEINARRLRGSNFTEVVRTLLLGEPGSSLQLVWLRPGEAGGHSASLIREPLDVKHIPVSSVPISLPR